MLEEMKLAGKPQRKVAEEAKKAEQQAFDRAYARTRKEVAKEQGAAAGAAAALAEAPVSALEAARQRALGGGQSAPIPTVGRPTAKSAAPAPASVRTVKLQTGETVPEQYYDLDPASQQRMLELIKEREAKEKDDSAALTAVNSLLDMRDRDSARVKALEGQLGIAVSVIEALQKRLDAMDLQVELAKSEALAEQEVGLAQMTTNLSAIRAEAGQEAAQHQAEREAAAVEHRQQLEAQAVAIEALRGSVKSSTTLMGERSNAVVAAVADAEGRQARLGVQLQELEGKTNAWTDPITRGEVTAMATDLVAGQWRDQVPAIVDAVLVELADQFPAGLGAQRVDSVRTRQLRSDAANFTDRAQGGPAR